MSSLVLLEKFVCNTAHSASICNSRSLSILMFFWRWLVVSIFLIEWFKQIDRKNQDILWIIGN